MLRTLHAGPRFRADFSMIRIAQGGPKYGDERKIGNPPKDSGNGMDRVALAAQVLAVLLMDLVFSHNDLSSTSVIEDGQRLRLIDFKNSGNNDPCYDIADLASQASLDDDLRAILCEAYFGAADPTLLAGMRLHSTIADVGWAVWASIQLRRLAARARLRWKSGWASAYRPAPCWTPRTSPA